MAFTSAVLTTRSVIVLIVLQFVRHAAAQDDSPYFAPAFSQLPADLRSYLSAVATATSDAAAYVGDYVTEPEFLPNGNHGPAYSEPIPFIQRAQTKLLQAATATAVPPDQRALLSSIVQVISADAATDGLYGSASRTASAPAGSTAGQTTMVTAPASPNAGGATTTNAVGTAASANASRAVTSSGSPAPASSTQASATPSSNGAASAVLGTSPVFYALQLLIIRAIAMVIR